jgi:hypothetical protein
LGERGEREGEALEEGMEVGSEGGAWEEEGVLEGVEGKVREVETDLEAWEEGGMELMEEGSRLSHQSSMHHPQSLACN